MTADSVSNLFSFLYICERLIRTHLLDNDKCQSRNGSRNPNSMIMNGHGCWDVVCLTCFLFSFTFSSTSYAAKHLDTKGVTLKIVYVLIEKYVWSHR